MKAKITEAPPVDAPDLVTELPAEGTKADPAGMGTAPPDPAGTKVDLAQQMEEGFRAQAVGLHGLPLKPEDAKVFYDRLELTEEMIALGRRAGLEPASLWARAKEYQAVHPDSWRELLAGHLTARAAGDLSIIPMDEKLRRGVVRSPERELEKLGERLEDALNLLRAEDRVIVLREVVEALELRTQIIVLKKGLIKDLEAKK
ncbi:hypothetical protein ES705_09409 [subsurface metagenome]